MPLMAKSRRKECVDWILRDWACVLDFEQGPCCTPQRTSKFTEKLAKTNLGAEIFAFIEIRDQMFHSRELYEPHT